MLSNLAPVWIECPGEAHKNPFIDNCLICMPYWKLYPTCPICGSKLKDVKRGLKCARCKVYMKKESA